MQTKPVHPAVVAAALLVSETTAAQMLGVCVRTLRKDRSGERRIPFMRIGKSVRYSPTALERFVAEQVRQ